MTMMEQQWRKYRDMCYPQGTPPIQESECRQAFYAGALEAIVAMDAIANCIPNEDQASHQVRLLTTEIHQVCEARILELNSRS